MSRGFYRTIDREADFARICGEVGLCNLEIWF